MKVYVVIMGVNVCTEIVKIFSTKDEAERFQKEKERNSFNEYYFIEEWEVE